MIALAFEVADRGPGDPARRRGADLRAVLPRAGHATGCGRRGARARDRAPARGSAGRRRALRAARGRRQRVHVRAAGRCRRRDAELTERLRSPDRRIFTTFYPSRRGFSCRLNAGPYPPSRPDRRHSTEGRMYDLLYIAGTIAFFALMLAYVAGCERSARDEDAPVEDAHDRVAGRGAHRGRRARVPRVHAAPPGALLA